MLRQSRYKAVVPLGALLLSAWAIAGIAAPASAAASPWPGTGVQSDIGAGLPGGYEPSGMNWHRRLGKLFLVSDGGIVTMMGADGSGKTNWHVGGDLEAVCVADEGTDLVYLGVEQPDSVREFNVRTGQVTRTFDLTPWMQGSDNQGLEALEFIPDPNNPEGGLFYAGLQADGSVWVFSLPIRSSATSTTVTLVRMFKPVVGRPDLSDMSYDREQGVLYAIYDAFNYLRAMRPDGTFLGEWNLPGLDQEGIVIRSCRAYVGEDTTERVWYTDFPSDPGDADGDGVTNCADLCPGTLAGGAVDVHGCSVAAACPGDDACDDRLFCNGTEWCDPGSGCMAGPPPGCPGQVCSEALDRCVDCLADAVCPAGKVCDVATGACVAPLSAPPLPIAAADSWRYFKGTVEPPAGWREVGFYDGAWPGGPGGFGYGEDCGAMHGTVLGDMQSNYASIYLRHSFRADNPASVTSLTLTMDYDDAFVAYLNGVLVAARNIGGSPVAHDRLAKANRECSISTSDPSPAEVIPISTLPLVQGTNVLAIQGHNLSPGSSDFSIIASLAYTRGSGWGSDSLWLKKLGNALHFTWGPIAGAADYVISESAASHGGVFTPCTTGTAGEEGAQVPMPAGTRFYLFAGRTSTGQLMD